METTLAFPLLHIQTNVKPIIGRDVLLGCIRAVAFYISASKGMTLPTGSVLEENVSGMGVWEAHRVVWFYIA